MSEILVLMAKIILPLTYGLSYIFVHHNPVLNDSPEVEIRTAIYIPPVVSKK